MPTALKGHLREAGVAIGNLLRRSNGATNRKSSLSSPEPPIVTIYFDFYGEFDPAEITKRLGIEPTGQFRAGEPRPSGLGHRRRNGWILKVDPESTFEIDELLKQIQAAVTATPEQIRQVSSELDVEAVVTCEVQATSAMPSLWFSHELVRWAASIGAAIDVDIMLLEGEEPEEVEPTRASRCKR